MSGIPGLFIPGPTNVPVVVQQAMMVPQENQRAPDFPAFTLPLFADLKKIFRTESGQVFIFPSSGTGGWESAVTNTLSPGDKVLIAVFGQFSHLWADLCRRHGLDVEVIDLEWGEGARPERYAERLAADRGKAIKAVLVCQNETATGVASSVADIRRALDDAGHPALLMVDGVSSIACIDFRMDEWGVDVAVSGSQKGFMLPTGMAIVAVSPKAMAAYEARKSPRGFFDFGDMARANKLGYFPYTPPTTLMRGLRASVDLLLVEGLDNVFARHHRMAGAVRAAVDAWGLRICATEPRWYSDTVTAIHVPDGFDSDEVVNNAHYNYGLSLGAGLSKVARKVFRIGHLGSLNELMVLQALAGTEMALHDSGIRIEAGSGVAAAEKLLRGKGRETLRKVA